MSKLLPDVAQFIKQLNTKDASACYAETGVTDPLERVNAQRIRTDQIPNFNPKPKSLPIMREFKIGELDARLYDRREHRAPSSVLIYFHGGGSVAGSILSHHHICVGLADYLDIPVIIYQQRLAPEHPWPSGPNDAEYVCRWVADNSDKIGTEVTGLVLAGDSSGGTLSISMSQVLRDNPAKVPVVLQAPFYPVPHGDGDYPSMSEFGKGYLNTREEYLWRKSLYQPDDKDVRWCPLFGQHHDMPPTVLVTTYSDMYRDSSREYAKKLIDAGNHLTYLEYSGTVHGFLSFCFLPSSQTYFEQIMFAMLNVLER